MLGPGQIPPQNGSVGHLPPGESVEARPPGGTDERIVWFCADGRGRTHVWSYDGRHHRLSKSDREGARVDLFYD